ncbi:MAG: CHAT domain-containing protein [Pseudomonadota bacterium]
MRTPTQRMPTKTSTLAAGALIAGAALLAACAPQERPTQVSDGALCAEIEQRANAAFRANFLTEYDEALRGWTEILSTYDERPDAVAACVDVPPRTIVLANIALVYSNQRNFTAADGMFKAAAALGDVEAVERTKIYTALHDLNRSAVGAETLARAEAASVSVADSRGLRLLEDEVSRSVLQLSAEAQRRLIEEGVNLAGLAFAYLSQNRTTIALRTIDDALARVAPIDGASASYVPRFKVTKAEILLGAGEPAAALAMVREAINEYGADIGRTALMGRAKAIEGRILATLGRDEAALGAFAEAFDILKGATVRVSYDLLYPYVALTRRIVAQNPGRAAELDEALFSAAQVVRSQVTASSVSVAAAARAEGGGPLATAIRNFTAAREELALVVAQRALVEGRNSLGSTALRADVQRRFDEARAREEAAVAALLALDPDFFDRLTGAAPIAEVQAALEPGEAYIQIVLGDPESLAFLITPDGYRVATPQALSVAEVNGIVAGLRDIFRKQLIYTPNESYRIYEAFIEPLEPDLAGIDQLVFSLSDALTVIPMEVLATRESATPDLFRLEDFTDVAWLGNAYEVSYVPAPRNLVELRARTVEIEPRPIIAFGDFEPGADPNTILEQSFLPDDCLPVAEQISQLPPLEGTRLEVESVSRLFGGSSVAVLGADFTEARVSEEDDTGRLEGFGVLHFATHGILPTGDCLRRPALSVTASGVSGSDGLLTDVEILRLSLDADLVVLSACDTAGPTDEDFNAEGGEALSGLARAFFDAGSSAVIASHWPVGDRVTAETMDAMYSGLRDGQTIRTALSNARRALARDVRTSDPIFWGPFVAIGDAGRRLSVL